MDERRGAVVGFDPVWGALLHNERAMAISSVWIPEAAVGCYFLYFPFEYFF